MKYLIYTLLGLSIFSCGEDKEEKNEDARVYIEKEPSTHKGVNEEKGLMTLTYSSDNEERVNFVQSILDAQTNAWGESLSFGFEPEMKAKDIHDAVTIINNDDKVNSLVPKVINRFKERCSTYFNKKRKYIDLNIVYDEKVMKGTTGQYVPPLSWYDSTFKINEKKVQSLLTFNPKKPFSGSISLFKLDSFDESEYQTYHEMEGENPWEWDYKDFFVVHGRGVYTDFAWDLYANKPNNYIDFTFAHELGHWLIDSQVFSEGKILVDTVYFSEILAQLTSAICYTSHLENKKALEDYVFESNKTRTLYNFNIDKYWPLRNELFEGDFRLKAPEIKDYESEDVFKPAYDYAYGDAKNKRIGFAGLIVALVLEDRFNPDFFASMMFESISEMKGRKLKCRKNDQSCAGTYVTYDSKNYPIDKRPYVYTLSEFLEIFSKKINVPEKASNMWNHYVKLINELEE